MKYKDEAYLRVIKKYEESINSYTNKVNKRTDNTVAAIVFINDNLGFLVDKFYSKKSDVLHDRIINFLEKEFESVDKQILSKILFTKGIFSRKYTLYVHFLFCSIINSILIALLIYFINGSPTVINTMILMLIVIFNTIFLFTTDNIFVDKFKLYKRYIKK